MNGHSIVLDGEWRLWDQVVLRGAGFAADGILGLATPDVVLAANDVRASNDFQSLPLGSKPARLLPLLNRYRKAFDRSMSTLSQRLSDLAASDRFREAVIWQNRRAWQTGIRPLLGSPQDEPHDRRDRARQQLVVSYWQRYCVKNDSIGFFGPIGWSRLEPGRWTNLVLPGKELISNRRVHFENWCIETLAATIASWSDMRVWARPRKQSYVRLVGDRIYAPGLNLQDVPDRTAHILGLCDGMHAAADIVEAAVGAGHAHDAEDAYLQLESLRRRRLIVWAFEIPVTPWPEIAFRRRLCMIRDPILQSACLTKLDRLETRKEAVAHAAGNPDALDRALEELESEFENLTGKASLRRAGQTYAARTLVFEDCQRDVTAEFGRSLLEALYPVALLLTSGRWFTHTCAAAFSQRLLSLYRRLTESGRRRLDLATLWFESLPLFHDQGPAIVDGIQADLYRKWAHVLQLDWDERSVRRTTAGLRPMVMTEFGVPHAGWAGARYQSPDVMIEADSLEKVLQGDFRIVVGEIHLAINSLRHACFLAQHPNPDKLFAALDQDFPRPRLLPVLPKESPPRLTARLHPALVRRMDLQVALFHFSADPSEHTIVSSADLLVDESDGQLSVVVNGHRFNVLDAFSEVLMGLVINRLKIAGDRPHTPRIVIDRAVVNRESWAIRTADLRFLEQHDPVMRFLEVQSLRHRLGLPAHVFVRSPLEDKPFYVDFDSPVLVELLARAVRKLLRSSPGSSTVRLTEMLPDVAQAWLPDAGGNRYTAELRFAAFDLLSS
jgi:hypothetical protein